MPTAHQARLCLLLAAFLLMTPGCSLSVHLEPEHLPNPCDLPESTIHITEPPENINLMGRVPVKGSVLDVCGRLERVEIEVSGLSWEAETERTTDSTDVRFNSTWDTAGAYLGEHIVRVNAVFAGGETKTATRMVNLFNLYGPLGATLPVTGLTRPSIVDIDDDGNLDIVTGGTLLMGDEQGGFQEVTGVLPPDAPLGFHALVDLDNNGYLEMVAPEDGNQGRVYVQVDATDNAVGFRFEPLEPAYPQLASFCFGALSAADIDNDGDVDLLAAKRYLVSEGCSVEDERIRSVFLVNRYIEDGTPSLEPIHTSIRGVPLDSSFPWPDSAVFGDLNADGYTDLVVSGLLGCGTRVYLNDPANPGYFNETDQDPALPDGEVVQLADYNNDGYLDLVFPQASDQPFAKEASLWENTGTGHFVEVTGQTRYRGGWLADLTNDGWLDAGADLQVGGEFVPTDAAMVTLGTLPLDMDQNGSVDVLTVRGIYFNSLLEQPEIRVAIRDRTYGNFFGLGARVLLVEGAEVKQLREIGHTASADGIGRLPFEARFGIPFGEVLDIRIEIPGPAGFTKCERKDAGPGRYVLKNGGGDFQCD